jgi:hypothetical protein
LPYSPPMIQFHWLGTVWSTSWSICHRVCLGCPIPRATRIQLCIGCIFHWVHASNFKLDECTQ